MAREFGALAVAFLPRLSPLVLSVRRRKKIAELQAAFILPAIFAILGQLFDRFGWTACVAGVLASLLVAALLTTRLEMKFPRN